MTAKFYHAGSLVKAAYSLCLLNIPSLTANCYHVSRMVTDVPSKQRSRKQVVWCLAGLHSIQCCMHIRDLVKPHIYHSLSGDLVVYGVIKRYRTQTHPKSMTQGKLG